MAELRAIAEPYPAQTVIVSNTAAAPAANAAIATIPSASLPPGLYRIHVHVGFGGTAETTTVNNFDLRVGATTLGKLAVQNTANGVPVLHEAHYRLDGSSTITVNASAAAAASTVYNATVKATKVGD